MATKEILIKLVGDTKDISSKLTGLNKTVKDTSQQSKKNFDSMGQSLLKIGKTIAGLAIAKKIYDIGKSAIQTAGQFEQFNVAFSTMLGSGEKAKNLLNEIKTFAATTPFELPEVVAGSKQLLAFGFAAEEIIPTMTTLGNIAAGLNVPISRLNLVFGQVRAGGRLMGQDLLQFTNAGVPMIAALAGVLGVSESAVKDMVSAGKVGFKEVQKALESLGGEGGKFGGLMIAQSKTIGGVFSNISDNITQVMMEIGTAMLPVVKIIAMKFLGALNKVRSWIASNSDTIKKVLVAGFIVLKNVIYALIPIMSGWISIISKLIKFPLTKWILAIVAAWKIFNLVLLMNPLVLIATTVIAFIGYLAHLIKTTGSVKKAFQQLWENIKKGIKILFEAGKLLFYAMTEQFGKIKDSFDDLKKTLKEPVKSVIGRTTVNSVEREQKTSVAPETMDKEGQKAADEYTKSFADALTSGKDSFKALGQTMGEQITQGILEQMFNPIAQALNQLSMNIVNVFMGTFGQILSPLTEFVGMGISMFGNFFQQLILQHLKFQKIFQMIWGGMAGFLGQTWTLLTTVIGGALGLIFDQNRRAAMGSALAWANQAAISAAASVAATPLVGAGLAAVAYASTLALLSVPALAIGALSFQEGGIVPGEGITKSLSPNELVVPERFSDLLRSGELSLSGGEGAGQGGNTFNIDFNGANFMGTSSEMIDQIESGLIEKFNILGSKIQINSSLGN